MTITLTAADVAADLIRLYDYPGSLLSVPHTVETLLAQAAWSEAHGYFPEAGHWMVRAMDLAFVEDVITDLSESDDLVALEAMGVDEAYRIVRTCKREYDYDALFCADEMRKRAGLL